jgi:DNA-directed RNA polymerase subunit RPC12/RpoP
MKCTSCSHKLSKAELDILVNNDASYLCPDCHQLLGILTLKPDQEILNTEFVKKDKEKL